jgi:hypothetical protein
MDWGRCSDGGDWVGRCVSIPAPCSLGGRRVSRYGRMRGPPLADLHPGLPSGVRSSRYRNSLRDDSLRFDRTEDLLQRLHGLQRLQRFQILARRLRGRSIAGESFGFALRRRAPPSGAGSLLANPSVSLGGVARPHSEGTLLAGESFGFVLRSPVDCVHAEIGAGISGSAGARNSSC